MQNFFKISCIALALFSSILFTSCLKQKTVKKITIAGSSTIMPISEAWASLFQEKTGIQVNVQAGGSTNGINLVKERQVDIGASSRDLNKKEEKGLKKIEIGKDALAVIINKSNSIENLTSDQLRKIFSGEISNWKEVGGKDKNIQVINRESGSGTRSTFEELVMCSDENECSDMFLSSIVLNSNAEVKRSVELISDSIGYISFGFLDSKVKSISLNDVAPLEDEVYAGSYPLARSLYYLIREEEHSKHLLNYLEFILSDNAQNVLVEEGYLRKSND